MLAALAGSSKRVQRVALSGGRALWIKRYEGLTPSLLRGTMLRRLAARLGPNARMLAPSPRLSAEASAQGEKRRIEALAAAGFRVPRILYQGPAALVLSDLGPNVLALMKALSPVDPQGHDALLVRCARELGRLHAAGLCHGRPHPRDFALDSQGFGFLDLEEDPAAVMPMPLAQARDFWLLFLQVASRALARETLEQALAAWRENRPNAAETALDDIIPMLARFLPLARFALRLRRGADIDRFILATDYLRSAVLLAHPHGQTGQNRFTT
ncbi:BUD32 family EKC/KEOPS complex subunit [Xaviernesmea oryzae]|nr:hypothetical protein [Xaviernesmea oryzae]